MPEGRRCPRLADLLHLAAKARFGRLLGIVFEPSAVDGIPQPREHGRAPEHSRGSGGPYACTKCNKSFRHKPHLVTHLCIHIGERPYLCSACSWVFGQSASLIDHWRVHTGERPYRCDRCRRSFCYKH